MTGLHSRIAHVEMYSSQKFQTSMAHWQGDIVKTSQMKNWQKSVKLRKSYFGGF